MSFSNAPDEATLGEVAGALAVDEAFIEKDWYVVQAIRILLTVASEYFVPIFSGGTCLVKAHHIINRFSEDIDFKLKLSEAFEAKSRGQKKTTLSNFKNAVADAWKKAGFEILEVRGLNENAFIIIKMQYPTVLSNGAAHASLRPHILAELSARPPRLPPLGRSIRTFVPVAQRGSEVPELQCIDPLETGADKLSAFAWRAILRDRAHENDDPTIVRHLHDLAVLEPVLSKDDRFPSLLLDTMNDDNDRGQGQLKDVEPIERLRLMNEKLATDGQYKSEYEQFVGGMTFAGDVETPSFDEAVQALIRLSGLIPTNQTDGPSTANL